jgi:chemotaxis protein methyltransferase CheR
MTLEDSVFKFYEEFLKKESGLIVTRDKVYLLETRLNPIVSENGLNNLGDLANKIKSEGINSKISKDVIESMTTNETSFFRDTRPFDNLEKVLLPYFIKNRTTKKLRIWSAACSSGQEIYSIAMILKDWEAKMPDWKIELVASDLSTEIIDKAKKGEYTQFEVQRGLPVQRLVKYFKQNGDKWLISDDIKKMVQFKQMNLLGNLSSMGTFDIVFCRNVLIYFDKPTKGQVIENIAKITPKDGVLLLGGAETVLGVTDVYKPLLGEKGLYIKEDSSFVAE